MTTYSSPNEEKEEGALFTPPPEGSESWVKHCDYREQTLALPLHLSLIETEIVDQCTLKSSHRKAALRSTQKQLARFFKQGFHKLDSQNLEQAKWYMFVLLVNEAIADRHLTLRNDTNAMKSLANSTHFRNNST